MRISQNSALAGLRGVVRGHNSTFCNNQPFSNQAPEALNELLQKSFHLLIVPGANKVSLVDLGPN